MRRLQPDRSLKTLLIQNAGLRDWQSYIEYYCLLLGAGDICRTVIGEKANVFIKTEFKKGLTSMLAHRFAFYNESIINLIKLYCGDCVFGNPYRLSTFNDSDQMLTLFQRDSSIKTMTEQHQLMNIHKTLSKKTFTFERMFILPKHIIYFLLIQIKESFQTLIIINHINKLQQSLHII